LFGAEGGIRTLGPSYLGRQTTNSTFRLLGAGLLGECKSVVVIVQINRRSMNKMEKSLGKQEFEAYRILPSAIDENGPTIGC
jgi:hypothetical protein